MPTVSVNLNDVRQPSLGSGYTFYTTVRAGDWSEPKTTYMFGNLVPSRIRWPLHLSGWGCNLTSGPLYSWSPTENTYNTTESCLLANIEFLRGHLNRGIPWNVGVFGAPPWAMSGGVTNPAKIPALATAITEFLKWAVFVKGLPQPDFIDINEPEPGGYSSTWVPNDYAAMVANAGPKFLAEGITTKWAVASTSGASQNPPYVSRIFNDPACRPYVGAISFHTYGGEPNGYDPTVWEAYYTTYAPHNVPIIMDEGNSLSPVSNPSQLQGPPTDAGPAGGPAVAMYFDTANKMARIYALLFYNARVSFHELYEIGRVSPQDPANSWYYQLTKNVMESLENGGVFLTCNNGVEAYQSFAYKHITKNKFYYLGVVPSTTSTSTTWTITGLPNTPLTFKRSSFTPTVERMATIGGPLTPVGGSLTLALNPQGFFSLSGPLTSGGTPVAPVLSSLSITPNSVIGPAFTTGTITLSAAAPSGGITVALASTNTAVAYISGAQSVVVPSGSTTITFTLNTNAVTSSSSATISAIYNTVTKTAPVTVLASTGTNIASQATVTVSTERPATGQLGIKAVDGIVDGFPGDYTKEWATTNEGAGAWIRLTWSSPRTISRAILFDRPNPNDQILAGRLVFSNGTTVTTGAFPITGAAAVYDFSARTVTWLEFRVDSFSGANVGLAEFEVYGTTSSTVPDTLTVNPTSVTGQTNSTGTVTLTSNAPVGGSTVTLTSSNVAAATMPTSVVVLAGQASATFTVTTYTVGSTTSVNISATLNTVTKVAVLTITAPGTSGTLSSVSITPTTMTQSSTAAGVVTIGSAAPAGGVAINLVSNYDRVSFQGGTAGALSTGTNLKTVTVLQGQTTVAFTLVSLTMVVDKTVTVTGTLGATSKSDTIAVTAPALPALPTPADGIPIPSLDTWRTNALFYGEYNWNYLRRGVAGRYDYDPADVWYQLAGSLTNNLAWREAARAGALYYTASVSAAAAPDFHVFTTGLVTDWLVGGYADSRAYIVALCASNRYTRDVASGGWALGDITYFAGGIYNARPLAYGIKALLDAMLVGEADKLARLTVLQNAAFHLIDYCFTGAMRGMKPPMEPGTYGENIGLASFWLGLLLWQMCRLYDKYGDANLLAYIKYALDRFVAPDVDMWVPAANAFRYSRYQGSTGSTAPAPDLNALISPAYAWYYKRSGDPLYQQRFDQMFQAQVAAAYLTDMKQYNEAYAFSQPAIQLRLTANPGTVTAPSAPTTLVANTISSSAITLTWDSTSSNEQGFKIERRVGAAAFAQVGLVGPGVETFADSGLTASTLYDYQVRAYNQGGHSAYTSIASDTTDAGVPVTTLPLTVPPNLATIASVTVSSERPDTGQLGIKAIDLIVDGYTPALPTPEHYEKEWASTGDVGTWIQLNWASPVIITEVILRDRPLTTSNITSGTLSFSDSSTIAVGALETAGGPTSVVVDNKLASWVRFTALTVTGINVGLAEIQVLGDVAPPPVITGPVVVSPASRISGALDGIRRVLMDTYGNT